MFSFDVERIGDVAVVHCEGRIVRSEAAFRLREAVTQQEDARAVVLDLSAVDALEGGGLGMLLFLKTWTREHDIEFKVFGPAGRVRQNLERAVCALAVEIADMGEIQSLLAYVPQNVPNSHQTTA
jgi:anti-anti-sigma regulatory factor